MQIAKDLAGFSGGEADNLRKAIGKKNREAMAKIKPKFVEGCRATGTSEQVTEWLWATNERSADYSFNRSHAACYTLIAYRTAWLKANYPAEYMAALISSVMDTKDKVPFFVSQAEQMGISILPPDVNLSTTSSWSSTATSGSGSTRSRASATRRSRRSSGPAATTPRCRSHPVSHPAVPEPVRLLRPGRQPLGQQEGDRGADQVRGVRLDRRDPEGHADRARAGPGRGSEGPAGRTHRPGLDLRSDARPPPPPPAGTTRRIPVAPLALPSHAPIPAVEFERAELLRPRRSRSACSSPPTR